MVAIDAGSPLASGVVLTLPIFEDAFLGPAGDGRAASSPARFALATTSNAIDRGRVIERLPRARLRTARSA